MRITATPAVQYWNSLSSVNSKNGKGIAANVQGQNKSGSQTSVSSAMKSLLEQKQHIIDGKKNLINTTTEKGQSLDSIKDQLKEYDDQLKKINEQISKQTAEEMKKTLEKNKAASWTSSSDSKTSAQDEQTAKVNSFLSLTSNISQIKTATSVRSKMEAHARVLKREIAYDGKYSLASKSEKLADLEHKISEVTGKITDQMKDAKENAAAASDSSASFVASAGSSSQSDDSISIYRQLFKQMTESAKSTVLDENA